MPLSSEPDRCTQVRYASVTNTGSVTDDCFSSLSPPPLRCSLIDLQLCVNVQVNSEMQNGSDIASPKQAPNKTRWFLNDEGLVLRPITL